MAKLLFILLSIMIISCLSSAANQECPLPSKISSCSPKCKDDSDCRGQKCCTNICSTKSCTPEHLLKGNDYKNPSSIKYSGTGTYCGQVKCNSFEKCQMDRSTSRPKCVRY